MSPAVNEPTAIAHLAGPLITFDGVSRQRCVWCGALIDERDIRNIGVPIDETASAEVQQAEVQSAARSKWEGWVLVMGTNPVMKTSIDEPGDERAPEESCMRLLPPDPEP
jgi:hypothetical protein